MMAMLAAPPKCTPSVTKTSLVIHLLGSLWYSFTIHNDQMYRNLPMFNRFGGRAAFLTMLTLYFTCVASWFSFLVDLIQFTTNLLDSVEMTKEGYSRNKSTLISIRDNIMSTIVCTFCTFVPIMYWSIAAVDLDGIHPEGTEEISPLFGWFNHAVHTIPVLYVIILTTCVNYEYASLKVACFEHSITIVGYISWMAFSARHTGGQWPYKFLMKQTDTEFVIFILSCIVVLIGLYLTTRAFASAAWNYRHYKIKDD